MKPRRLAATALLALSRVATAADMPEPPIWAGEAGVTREHLTRGQAPWSSRYLAVERRQGAYRLRGAAQETERYGLADSEASAGLSVPLGNRSDVNVDVGLSATHRVLPSRYGAIHFDHRPAAGWSLGTGLRHSDYRDGSSDVADFRAERYAGAERFAYTLYAGRPGGGDVNASHRFEWSHYYGDREWVGISLVAGRESEHVAAGFLTSRVRAAAIVGRHEFGDGWALSWEAGTHRQGDAYTRRGLRLGIARTF